MLQMSRIVERWGAVEEEPSLLDILRAEGVMSFHTTAPILTFDGSSFWDPFGEIPSTADTSPEAFARADAELLRLARRLKLNALRFRVFGGFSMEMFNMCAAGWAARWGIGGLSRDKNDCPRHAASETHCFAATGHAFLLTGREASALFGGRERSPWEVAHRIREFALARRIASPA